MKNLKKFNPNIIQGEETPPNLRMLFGGVSIPLKKDKTFPNPDLMGEENIKINLIQ